jgi:hypothetical protein
MITERNGYGLGLLPRGLCLFWISAYGTHGVDNLLYSYSLNMPRWLCLMHFEAEHSVTLFSACWLTWPVHYAGERFQTKFDFSYHSKNALFLEKQEVQSIE